MLISWLFSPATYKLYKGFNETITLSINVISELNLQVDEDINDHRIKFV